MRGSNDIRALQFRPKQQEIPAACIYKLRICFACPEVGLKWTLMTPDPLVCFCWLARDQKSTQNKFPCCLYFEVCFPDLMTFGSEESFWNFQIQSEIMATICSLFILITFSRPKGKPFVSWTTSSTLKPIERWLKEWPFRHCWHILLCIYVVSCKTNRNFDHSYWLIEGNE